MPMGVQTGAPNNGITGGYLGGIMRPDDPTQRRQNTSPLDNQYSIYNSAIKQSGKDYDEIMRRYRDFLNGNTTNVRPINYQPQTYTPLSGPTPITSVPNIDPHLSSYKPENNISPSMMTVTGASYKPSADVTNALGKLQELSITGGYTPQDINDIRERGISPIRSIYANAQREMSRKRALAGGYSPNYNYASSKMTREMADVIGSKTTDLNAQIAENIARNKLAAAPGYATAAQAEQNARDLIERENAAARLRVGEVNAGATNAWNARNADSRAAIEAANAAAINRAREINNQNRLNIDRYNTEGINETNRLNWQNASDINRYNNQGINDTARFNAGLGLQANANTLAGIQGMLGLYGTIPGLPNLYGTQAQNAAQLQNQIAQQNRQLVPGIIGSFR